jgi:hypothetical protein
MYKQDFLPGFPDGAQKIGLSGLSILEKDGVITYFLGGDNYFSHPKGDRQSERFVLTSLMENGHVRVRDLEGAPLVIPRRTLMNWKAQYQKDGPTSFFRPLKGSKPRVMTPEKIAECTTILAGGVRPAEAARRAGLKESTLRKALARKAIPDLPLDACEGHQLSSVREGRKGAGASKSERSRTDGEAAGGLGVACTRADERVAAAMGLAGSATARFEAGCDVQMGGLLAALPALCANGLLSGLDRHLRLPKGFYSALHILLTLGFMALGRIRRPEGLRHIPPGELGKVVGLDRVPEVRTLRQKISHMASTGDPGSWMKELAKMWMEADPDEAGYLYVDGHVRVYTGDEANLPRRYVSRQRLCLRGTTDYWVNDAIGRPFFVVSKAVSSGLADCLLKDIAPDLLASVPGQPTEEALEQDPLLHRFVIVFDREGATHSLLAGLWKHRIGAITYRKNVKDVWPESEFFDQEAPVPGGGSCKMQLAMRETKLSAGQNAIAVTEVRRLTPSGHQTAIVTTARRLASPIIASRMFARWRQENFFAYMMQHYDIDGLIEYGAETLPGTLLVVNPERRELEKAIAKARQAERRLQADLTKQDLAKQDLADGADIQKKAETVETLQDVQAQLVELRAKRKTTPQKVTIESLPEEQRPTQLAPLNKILVDTVKMIAYRAETTLVALLQRHLKKEDEARALVRELLVSSADIEPDDDAKTLTVRVHRTASPAHDKAIAALLHDLTSLEFRHPETGAKMLYILV